MTSQTWLPSCRKKKKEREKKCKIKNKKKKQTNKCELNGKKKNVDDEKQNECGANEKRWHSNDTFHIQTKRGHSPSFAATTLRDCVPMMAQADGSDDGMQSKGERSKTSAKRIERR